MMKMELSRRNSKRRRLSEPQRSFTTDFIS
jgi:hypothetical protein